VTGEREPTVVGTAQESLSLAERLANAYSAWLHDDLRPRRRRFEPLEIVLFSAIAGVTFIIIAQLLAGFATVGNQDAWNLIAVTTQWAELPVAIALLGASLLGWYQSARCCDEFEMYLNQDEPDQDETGDNLAIVIDQAMTLLLRRLTRSRSALACIGVLALLTAAAAIAGVVWEFHSTPGFVSRPPWYGYVAYVAEGLATVIPSLACLMIAARAWAGGSYLLRADEPAAAFEDAPEQPAEHEAVS
jgi:hypothetical protein